MTSVPTPIPAAIGQQHNGIDLPNIQAALAEPFDPRLLKCKPGVVKGTRALAFAYVDARDVADRLDEVLGIGGWRDDYELLPDGNMLCRLSVKIDGEFIQRCGVGGPSDQSEGPDRSKAAESDSFKRAAVKFGVGRYLYRLPLCWLAFDPERKRFTERPTLPPWAVPQLSAGKGPAIVSDDDAELCDAALAREVDFLIRTHSKAKRWHAALAALAIPTPPEWAEPAGADDAPASVCQWLSRSEALRLKETILRYAGKANGHAPAKAG
jgi:hypothetical protein